MEEKKRQEEHAVGPEAPRTCKENLLRILKGLFFCVVVFFVVFFVYRHATLECENAQLSKTSLKTERENARLSERLLEVERKLQELDKMVQTLWNEEEHYADDVLVQSNKVDGMDGMTVFKRMKRETWQEEEKGGRPNVDEKSELHRDVIAVHVEGRADGQTSCDVANSFQIEEGHDIITKWHPLRYPDEGFTLEDGILTVEKTGLYFIYSQILYLEDPDADLATTHSVVVNEEEVFLTCMNSMVGVPPWHTCYTAGVRALEANSAIHISMKCDGCCISLSSDATFFGAILLKEYEEAPLPMKFQFTDIFFPNESRD
ncbi:PREDICTED: uncharacterized protein LOC109461674 [Branchiostoma belcheri]|uniref:Uncharacterized protein LOC109461674 n=1 Tax=Branchiostoma belcheri TaxID=7741 RepID=A0A6P4XSF3_BRABE|nr:PREDICTED: uncharacterized protein LOC109461674 [Branchiostoma belcheri]